MKPHRGRIPRPGWGVGAAMLPLLFASAVVALQPAQAQTYTVLYAFTGTGGDASGPTGDLIRDAAGNLYGTSIYGGASGLGTVFKLDSTGTETVLYSFAGGADGETPNAGLVRDTAGSFYGTTQQGGTYKFGTVFKLDTTGTETILHSFGAGNDGQYPRAGLIRDAAGNLYGTASEGGTYAQGIVFKIDATGAETVLYNFPGGADGWGPIVGVIRDTAGNLYGSTTGGGDQSCDCGTVFKLDTTGTETVLHTFTYTDGARPGSVTMDSSGNLYGTTVFGGITSFFCRSGCGTVFKLDVTGTYTLLHSFTGKRDGKTPATSLIRDAAGNLFGTTEVGGAFNRGTVFRIGPLGRETVLYSFSGGTDGSTPGASVVEDSAGNLYGVAQNGGAFGYGTVFKLTP